jgi:hypothetical protein
LIGNKIAVNTVNFLFCGLLQSRVNVDLSNEQLEDCVGCNRVGLFIVGCKVVWGMVWGGVWGGVWGYLWLYPLMLQHGVATGLA